MYTEQLTQRKALMNGIPPQTLNASNTTTGTGVDMTKSRRAFFNLYIGAVAAGGSIDAKLVESVNANLSSPSDLAGTGVSITGKVTTNKMETFEVRAGQMTKRYLGLKVTETAGFAVLVAATAEGDEGIHKPNNANNDTQVDTQSVVS